MATFRISRAHDERLRRAAEMGGYKLTLTSIIERGIDLACDEIEKLKEKQT